MNKSDLENKLKQLNTEDFIWVIYLGIIFFSWYSNSLERKYYVYNDLKSKEKYRHINEIIFTILLIVYIYFLKGSYEDYKNLKESDSNKKKKLVTLAFLASLLITISGAIFLYISFIDNDLDVELAFN
jgi:UDP-N-acetylmuramyl pentapeptide phosphotransferase/UDP-N-acetylglucosamine-1-phosphate transferase